MQRTKLNRVSKRQRQELRRRSQLKKELILESEGLCQQCGNPPNWIGLELSHTLPLGRGGKTTKDNCQVLCHSCHSLRHHIKIIE